MEKWLLTDVLGRLNQNVDQCKPKLQPNLIANDAFSLYGKANDAFSLYEKKEKKNSSDVLHYREEKKNDIRVGR